MQQGSCSVWHQARFPGICEKSLTNCTGSWGGLATLMLGFLCLQCCNAVMLTHLDAEGAYSCAAVLCMLLASLQGTLTWTDGRWVRCLVKSMTFCIRERTPCESCDAGGRQASASFEHSMMVALLAEALPSKRPAVSAMKGLPEWSSSRLARCQVLSNRFEGKWKRRCFAKRAAADAGAHLACSGMDRHCLCSAGRPAADVCAHQPQQSAAALPHPDHGPDSGLPT